MSGLWFHSLNNLDLQKQYAPRTDNDRALIIQKINEVCQEMDILIWSLDVTAVPNH